MTEELGYLCRSKLHDASAFVEKTASGAMSNLGKNVAGVRPAVVKLITLAGHAAHAAKTFGQKALQTVTAVKSVHRSSADSSPLPIDQVPVAERADAGEKNTFGMPWEIPSPIKPAHAAISPSILACHQPRSTVSEQFRQLRTTLIRLADREPVRCMISSAQPREGKTTTSCNLAWSFSELSQKRTLLIDADLRRGHIAESVWPVQRGGPGRVSKRQVLRRGGLPQRGSPKLSRHDRRQGGPGCHRRAFGLAGCAGGHAAHWPPATTTSSRIARRCWVWPIRACWAPGWIWRC